MYVCVPIAAGVCWEKKGNGKCKRPVQRSISKAECCAAGPDAGFTEKDMSDYEYFFATSLGENSECMSCIGTKLFFLTVRVYFTHLYFFCTFAPPESCATAKCGKSKRCVMRNGQPKCVCSPKCGGGSSSIDGVANKYQRREDRTTKHGQQLTIISNGTNKSRHGNRSRTKSISENLVTKLQLKILSFF